MLPTGEIDYTKSIFSEDNKFLIENYARLNNEEIGKALNRTSDAVRKQLNKLMLRRPKKSELKKLDKKAGSGDFFGSMKKGLVILHAKQVENRRIDKKLERMGKEKKWAQDVHGIGAEPKGKATKPEAELVWINIDDRTRMQVPKGTEAKWMKKFADRQLCN